MRVVSIDECAETLLRDMQKGKSRIIVQQAVAEFEGAEQFHRLGTLLILVSYGVDINIRLRPEEFYDRLDLVTLKLGFKAQRGGSKEYCNFLDLIATRAIGDYPNYALKPRAVAADKHLFVDTKVPYLKVVVR